MIRYDTIKGILWIEADDYDQAWDMYRENPIPVPEIRAIVIQAEIAHLLRGSHIDSFFKERKSAITEIIEENREHQYIHILPFAARTGKYQFLLTSPVKMWEFEIPEGSNPETTAINQCEDLIERDLHEDETLIGVLREERGKDTHYYFLLVLEDEFRTPISTVWISRKNFSDWKWSKDTKNMIENPDVVDITGKSSPYTKLVNSLVN